MSNAALQLDIRFDAPSAPGSETSRRAAELVKDSPFRRTSWRRILLTLGSLAPGNVLSREEIAARIGVKEGPLCARLSELKGLWVEVVEGACVSTSRISVNGYRLTRAGREYVGARRVGE